MTLVDGDFLAIENQENRIGFDRVYVDTVYKAVVQREEDWSTTYFVPILRTQIGKPQ